MAWEDNFISASDFDSIRLSIASNEDIKEYNSFVEKNPEKADTIKEFINAGITDTRKIEKALKNFK